MRKTTRRRVIGALAGGASLAVGGAALAITPLGKEWLVFFDTDAAKISADAKAVLMEAASYPRGAPKGYFKSVTVIGHADAVEHDALALSARRAKAVKAYLATQGLGGLILSARWVGRSELAVPDAKGPEPLNRRAAIRVE